MRNGNSITVSLQKYFEGKIAELDQRLTLAIAALKDLIITRLDSMDRAATSLAISSQKAIDKAETAQADYNVRSNEFRGQLDDQAKTLMPRVETIGLFKSQEDKMYTVTNALERRIDEARKEIAILREARSETGGEKAAIEAFRVQASRSTMILIAMVGLAISVAGLALAIYTKR